MLRTKVLACAAMGSLYVTLPLLLAACAHMKTGGSREVLQDQSGRPVSEVEVQQDLQRFAGQYLDRNTEAMEDAYRRLDTEKQYQLMKRALLYDSSVLDIVTGKTVVVNLLDLLVFTALTRQKFEEHWQPKVFGEAGAPVLEALRRSEEAAWDLGDNLLNPEQIARLRGLIAKWERENPGQDRVEYVRLSEFSRTAGRVAAKNDEASGLLASVNSVTQTADAAVLLGERAMFLAQRAGFLLRLQVRLAAYEVAHDSVRQLEGQTALLDRTEHFLDRTDAIVEKSTALMVQTGELEPMLQELTVLTQNATIAAQEARLLNAAVAPLAERFSPLMEERVNARGEPVTALENLVDGSNELSERTAGLLSEVRSLLPEGRGDQRFGLLRTEMDKQLRRIFGYLALLGAAWAVFFWGGYYLVRRRMDERVTRGSGGYRGHQPPPGARPSSAG